MSISITSLTTSHSLTNLISNFEDEVDNYPIKISARVFKKEFRKNHENFYNLRMENPRSVISTLKKSWVATTLIGGAAIIYSIYSPNEKNYLIGNWCFLAGSIASIANTVIQHCRVYYACKEFRKKCLIRTRIIYHKALSETQIHRHPNYTPKRLAKIIVKLVQGQKNDNEVIAFRKWARDLSSMPRLSLVKPAIQIIVPKLVLPGEVNPNY